MVLLSDSNQFDRLIAGLDALAPVGFLKQDVFVYDPMAAEAIASGSVNWSSLRNFYAPVTATRLHQNEAFVSSE
jgi:hypothetical protein